MVTLKEAKKQFKEEWIAFLIKEKQPSEEIFGEVLEHNKDKRELHKQLRKREIKDAYITFAGPYVKPGYEVMF